MKTKILIVLMLFWMSSFAQTLEEQYIKYCEADSNKILIGFNYVIGESKKDTSAFALPASFGSWSTYYEVYNPSHKKIIPYEDYRNFAPSWTPFTEENIWNWRQDDLLNSASQYNYKHEWEDYIRCEKITMPLEPTFKGFVEWKQKLRKQYNLDSIATQTVKDLNKVKWREN